MIVHLQLVVYDDVQFCTAIFSIYVTSNTFCTAFFLIYVTCNIFESFTRPTSYFSVMTDIAKASM